MCVCSRRSKHTLGWSHCSVSHEPVQLRRRLLHSSLLFTSSIFHQCSCWRSTCSIRGESGRCTVCVCVGGGGYVYVCVCVSQCCWELKDKRWIAPLCVAVEHLVVGQIYWYWPKSWCSRTASVSDKLTDLRKSAQQNMTKLINQNFVVRGFEISNLIWSADSIWIPLQLSLNSLHFYWRKCKHNVPLFKKANN